MAAFHSIIYGRFWVITKENRKTAELRAQSAAGPEADAGVEEERR
jgi:hypothetical protein